MDQSDSDPRGTVVSIHTAAEAGDAMVTSEEIRAVEGQGLEGDRYFRGVGSYSELPKPGREVTLIEHEALAAASAEAGVAIDPRDSRRNIVTRDIRLNDLIGREFWVGDVKMRAVELCEPCAYMAGLAGKPMLKSLVNRGGIRAAILTDGMIRVGDAVRIDDSVQLRHAETQA
jgi:MOSC domain-containing protein YiiM